MDNHLDAIGMNEWIEEIFQEGFPEIVSRKDVGGYSFPGWKSTNSEIGLWYFSSNEHILNMVAKYHRLP